MILAPTDPESPFSFTYRGLRFSQDDFHSFIGLNAVDSPESVEAVMKVLKTHGERCTRMGAYKPRTSPYTFGGLEARCLPYVFELAGKYDIQIIAMEVTHESHIEQIDRVLDDLGHPTGVMLQTGTRNAQNFELLKAVGRQNRYPVLYKRGFGITLQESIQAAEYIAMSGNDHLVFCLRGMKTQASAAHRNLADFSQVPLLKRLLKTPICVDPSHAIGLRANDNRDNLCDIFHAAVQGVIAGANMLLVDCHPNPPEALVDARQALSLKELPWFLEDIQIAKQAYQQRLNCAKKWKEIL